MKFVVLIYSIVLILLAIIGFILSTLLDDDTVQPVWDRLSPLSKQHYNNSISELKEENLLNLILVAIYYIICGIILAVIFGISLNMENNMQANYYPVPKPRRLGLEPSTIYFFIFVI